MVTVALVSAGFLGSGRGGALLRGGARVVTTVDGRTVRTARLAAEAGLEVLPTLTDVLAVADVVLSVTPPGAALETARAIVVAARRTDRLGAPGSDVRGSTDVSQGPGAGSGRHGEAAGGRPGAPEDAGGGPSVAERAGGDRAGVATAGSGERGPVLHTAGRRAGLIVADLNAVSPETMARVAEELVGVRVVDGSISGPPPSVRPGARLYLSGAAAEAVASLPWRGAVEPVVLDDRVGTASALKMCTGSVYKGLTALITQAMRTAGSFGVLDAVVADLERNGLADNAGVARSATKAHRFVDEMREVAATQGAAGLTPELFEAVAEVYAGIARTSLAQGDPENERDLSPAEIVARLRG